MDPLAKAANDYRAAIRRADEARAALHVEILRALGEGRRQAEVVRVTDYTRERIRQLTRAATAGR